MTMTLSTVPMITSKLLDVIKTGETAATVLCLHGDLGAGKTTLTQEIARQLGIVESVTSPTFVIMKKYKTTNTTFTNLVHIDAYRLTKSEELLNLGWNEVLREKHTLIIIEWAEHVPECIPENAYHVRLNHLDNDTRTIEF